ncbi:MAG: hypothetical protein QOG82_2052 [Actinomycetota bacterium]|jgi:hypothetical protein|nr:hypothetical protein [Actinomycetota bacterium]
MRPRFLPLAAAALALASIAAACGDDDPAVVTSTTVSAPTTTVAAASVRITSPADGATVTSPVKVVMAATGFVIEPAGAPRDGAGHFHVLVDVGCVTAGQPIAVGTAGINHFGKAQTEADLELAPGEHRLCLQAGDGTHVALPLTDEITVVVAPA